MSRRPRWKLQEIRQAARLELDNTWVTVSELARRLDLDHGREYLQLALVLERLVVDGEADIKTPGGTVRRFRRAS